MAIEDYLTVSQIAKIRDTAGVTGMDGAQSSKDYVGLWGCRFLSTSFYFFGNMHQDSHT